MDFKSGLFLLFRIDMMGFNMRSSNVSSAISDSIECVQVSIDFGHYMEQSPQERSK